jgi:hypothetical protein
MLKPGFVNGQDFVLSGAQVNGGRGDALLRVDAEEHERRVAAGLGAITDLWLLDRLLTLPLCETIQWADLADHDVDLFRRSHSGVVKRSAHGIRRLMVPAVDVSLVVVRQTRWRVGLRAAAAFEPFAQRVLLIPNPPRELSSVLWEADFLGVGIWTGTIDAPEQLLAPGPWKRRYVKGAGWRFAERAYGMWLNAMSQSESSDVALGRPARPADAAAGQQPLLHVLDAVRHDV